MSSSVVLAPAFFLEAVAKALLFLAFAIVDGGSFSFPSLSVMSSALLSSVSNKINYLINYRKSYYVQFGQTRVFLIAVC